MMIYFVRSFISDYDGKIRKYFSVLQDKGISYKFVGWDRKGSASQRENEILYKRRSLIGGGVKNIFNIFLWNIFVFFTLFRKRKEINIVHAIDFDSALSVWLFCKMFDRRIIFDIYDKYTDSKRVPRVVAFFIDRLERAIIVRSDLTILADSCRFRQHGLSGKEGWVRVLENVPN